MPWLESFEYMFVWQFSSVQSIYLQSRWYTTTNISNHAIMTEKVVGSSRSPHKERSVGPVGILRVTPTVGTARMASWFGIEKPALRS